MTMINDAGDLARHALTFHLESMLGPTVIVGDGFQRVDQDDVEPARALQMMQRQQEFARVQPVGGAQIRLAALSESFRLC